ncbi:MAG: hypothetical protein NXI09_09165 [Bacteroidetes bacterium]|nr:hypothetical protein [Bacteroidota bacterium]
MRTEDFHKLLDDPRSIEGHLVDDLKVLAARHPYSQIVQLMYGLRLRTSSEHLFNQQLGKTAVLTNDRAVLFELFENKTPTINKGVSTIEVEQSAAALVLPELAEAPPEKPRLKEETQPESLAQAEPRQEIEVKETASKEVSTGPSLEQTKPEEKPKEEKATKESQPLAAEPKAQKVELPSATPENLEGLSPAERVQAILKRNRELRAQFDANKSGEGEKLWETKKEDSNTETLPESSSVKDEVSKLDSNPEPEQEAIETSLENKAEEQERIDAEEPTSTTIEEKLDEIESPAQADTSSESANGLSATSKEDVEEQEEAVDPKAILEKIKGAELSNEIEPEASVEETVEDSEAIESQESAKEFTEMASEQVSNEETEDQAEEEDKEPWADSPIDIEALIRRRFARRFEREAEEENEYDPWEETEAEPSETTEPSAELATENDQEEAVAEDLASEQTAIEPEEEKQVDAAAAPEQKEQISENEASPSEPIEGVKSDLALAARIRMIRERLEGLKGNDAISREELEILMEEHRQLENLMADLPLDEDQLFEVELETNTQEDNREESPNEPDEDSDNVDKTDVTEASTSDSISLSPDEADLKEVPTQENDAAAAVEPAHEEEANSLSTSDENDPEAELVSIQREEEGTELDENLVEQETHSSKLDLEEDQERSAADSQSLGGYDAPDSENQSTELAGEDKEEAEFKEENRTTVFEIEKETEAKLEQGESEPNEDLVEDSSNEATEAALETEAEIEAEKSISESEEHKSDNSESEAPGDPAKKEDELEESSPSIAESKPSEFQAKEEDSSKETEEAKEKTTETKKEEAEAEEPEDLDSEIARIEALAAELRSGRNRDMSQNDINSLREQRMNEMIEQRKKDLEIKDSEAVAETEDSKEEQSQEETVANLTESEAISAASQEQEEAADQDAKDLHSEDENELNREGETESETEAADSSPENIKEDEESSEEDSSSDSDTRAEPSEEGEQDSHDEIIDEVVEEQEYLSAKVEDEADEEVLSEEVSSADEVDTEENASAERQFEQPIEQDSVSEEISAIEDEIADEASIESEAGSSFSDWLKKVSGGVNADQEAEEENNADASEKTLAIEDDAEVEQEPEDADGQESGDQEFEEETSLGDEESGPKQEIAEKIDLLDAFVEKLPDLKKKNRDAKTSVNLDSTPVERSESEGSGLVTETLAKVYIRQKHYKKAIQAYEILMLKYPEKSSFFASQISEIKKLANSK